MITKVADLLGRFPTPPPRFLSPVRVGVDAADPRRVLPGVRAYARTLVSTFPATSVSR
jgi:hypothetical protein